MVISYFDWVSPFSEPRSYDAVLVFFLLQSSTHFVPWNSHIYYLLLSVRNLDSGSVAWSQTFGRNILFLEKQIQHLEFSTWLITPSSVFKVCQSRFKYAHNNGREKKSRAASCRLTVWYGSNFHIAWASPQRYPHWLVQLLPAFWDFLPVSEVKCWFFPILSAKEKTLYLHCREQPGFVLTNKFQFANLMILGECPFETR